MRGGTAANPFVAATPVAQAPDQGRRITAVLRDAGALVGVLGHPEAVSADAALTMLTAVVRRHLKLAGVDADAAFPQLRARLDDRDGEAEEWRWDESPL